MILAALRVVVATITAISAVALLYVEVALPLIAMGTEGGEYAGPFSTIMLDVQSIIPPLLALLLLGIVVWLVVSTVQRERRVKRRR